MKSEEVINLLQQHQLLKIIDQEVDIDLEIGHISYIEVKKPNSKALLFTNVVDKKNNKKFDNVLTNLFCNEEAIKLFIGDVEKIANEIEKLLKLKPPKKFLDKIDFFKTIYNLKYVPPKRLNTKGICQEIIIKEHDVNLYDLPILKTWEKDGGRFITMGQVYTQSLDGSMYNLGMYRLQVFDNKTLGVHFQIHKDSNHFFHEYKKAKVPMPISIAIGGDPLYIWCGQAPLPIGVFELMLYGFIKKQNAKLVKCITNDLYVPEDVDYVIEGFIDPNKLKIEGPFGDHTGYYTLEEEYPFMEVKTITKRKNSIFSATVVGKPPLEDKYMGYATERIFLPLLKTTAPDLIDYYMPENGVFHNLILAKIKPLYPAHALQIMHSFWGVGQMSFVKHAIFVNEQAPDLKSKEIIPYILNRFDINKLLISKGIVDALDHSSDEFAVGGKLGIDATGDEIDTLKINFIDEQTLSNKIAQLSNDFIALKQYFTNTKNPITLIQVHKTSSQSTFINKLLQLNHIRIGIILDDYNNDLNNLYMILWRVVNNIDANRDIFIQNQTIIIDATTKTKADGFHRRWPDDVECNVEVIKNLIQKGLIQNDIEFFKKFQIVNLKQIKELNAN